MRVCVFVFLDFVISGQFDMLLIIYMSCVWMTVELMTIRTEIDIVMTLAKSAGVVTMPGRAGIIIYVSHTCI